MALEDSDSYVETSFGRNSWIENAVGNLLGLDSESGDPAWKVEMQKNIEQSAINRAFQREMADLQYYRSSPANQMRLYREAGLNPSLMYGQMSDLQTSVPAGSEASHGGAPNGQFASLLGLIPDAARVAGDLSLIPEQKALLDAQKQEILSRIPLNQSKVDLNNASIQDVVSKIQQRLHQNALTDAERENISFDQMYKNYQLDLSYRRLENETNLTNAQVQSLEANTRKALAEAQVSEREFYEMCYTFAIRAAGLEAQVHLTEAQTDQAYATAKKLGADQQAIEQGIRMNTPEEMYQQSATDDLTGKNGVVNMIGRQAIMAGSKVLRAFGGVVHLNYKMN